MVKLKNKIIIRFRTEKEFNKILDLFPNTYNTFYNYKEMRQTRKTSDLQVLIRNGNINGYGSLSSYTKYSPEIYQFIDINDIIKSEIIEIW